MQKKAGISPIDHLIKESGMSEDEIAILTSDGTVFTVLEYG